MPLPLSSTGPARRAPRWPPAAMGRRCPSAPRLRDGPAQDFAVEAFGEGLCEFDPVLVLGVFSQPPHATIAFGLLPVLRWDIGRGNWVLLPPFFFAPMLRPETVPRVLLSPPRNLYRGRLLRADAAPGNGLRRAHFTVPLHQEVVPSRRLAFAGACPQAVLLLRADAAPEDGPPRASFHVPLHLEEEVS